MCFFTLKACQHILLHQIHKMMIFKKASYDPFKSSLKLQSVNFASLLPSLFENLELQLCAELSSLRGLYSGTAPARMNLMF